MTVLAPQSNYQIAVEQATLRLQTQSPEVLAALGARTVTEEYCTLPVLNAVLAVDFATGRVTLGDREVRATWQILTLHYLAASVPSDDAAAGRHLRLSFRPEGEISTEGQISPSGRNDRALHSLAASAPSDDAASAPSDDAASERKVHWISFADIPDGRGYERIYYGRVVRRLCATTARDRATFVQAAQSLGAQRAAWGDEGFQFQVFPRLPVIVAWYDGDDELPPNASFVYPDTIQSLLPVEDVIVLSEGVVGRLQGKDW